MALVVTAKSCSTHSPAWAKPSQLSWMTNRRGNNVAASPYSLPLKYKAYPPTPSTSPSAITASVMPCKPHGCNSASWQKRLFTPVLHAIPRQRSEEAVYSLLAASLAPMPLSVKLPMTCRTTITGATRRFIGAPHFTWLNPLLV